MIRLELSAAAAADLADILDYGIATFGEAAAEAYLRSFENAFTLLRDHPRAGAVHTEAPADPLPLRDCRCERQHDDRRVERYRPE